VATAFWYLWGRPAVKRFGNLFDKIIAPDNLFAAYLDARQGKRKFHACYSFERRIGHHIEDLGRRLADGSYRPKAPNCFYVYEPKKRLIEAPSFPDLVVQHAVYRIVMPIFDATFTRNSFACRKGFGTHLAADYVQDRMRLQGNGVSLKIDCRKFFYSIDREVLRGLIERKIKCPQTLALMALFNSRKDPRGVSIGNLLSQMYALIYLNPVDHFIKRDLKVAHYARYVDDLVIFTDTRSRAMDLFERIKGFLSDRLGLEVSKYSIAPISRGINCFGFRTWRTRRFARKRALYVARRSLIRNRLEGFSSSLGHAKKTGSFRFLMRMAQELNDGIFVRVHESFRPVHNLLPES
jgi:RNA-directed DNA polymerase